MTRILQNITETLADAALLEMGVDLYAKSRFEAAVQETLEETLVEVAFAEAAVYDDIHEVILKEHRDKRDMAHPDDCRCGHNDLCYV